MASIHSICCAALATEAGEIGRQKPLCLCVARVLSITITFWQSDAFRRCSPKWLFFRFILALSWIHTAPPVINAIASNAAVTHKQASHASGLYRFGQGLGSPTFNNHKFMTFNKRIIFFRTYPRNETAAIFYKEIQ